MPRFRRRHVHRTKSECDPMSQKRVLRDVHALLKSRAKTFRTDAEILEAAKLLLLVRRGFEEGDESAPEEQEDPRGLEESFQRRLHERLRRSGKTHIGRTVADHRFDEIETEILLVLTLGALGLCERVRDVEDIQAAFAASSIDGLSVLQALRENGRLAESRLILLEENDTPVEMQVKLSQSYLAPIVRGDRRVDATWAVKTYEAFLDKTYVLAHALRERSEAVEMARRGGNHDTEIEERVQAFSRHEEVFRNTLDEHPDWPLHAIDRLPDADQAIVLALLGKELGFFQPEDDLFTGEGLAQAVSRNVIAVRHNLRLLRRDGRLRRDGIVRVCGGATDDTVGEDEATLRACEFELTKAFLETIQVKRQRRSSQTAREAKVRLDQLVLATEVHKALEMVLVQARHGQTLIEDWGIGEVIPYGRAVTVLFSGAPGLGKTATAEAIAHELGKPIIAVNYAEIQNCFVGETEKNIVKVFREASEADAVLFWDEADAMFYDRDSATRSWEVRDVNVLLQELERFEGVCVLSTNRTITLDHALERRIAVKVEFERPTRTMRRAIWQKLLPDRMPLAKDVNLDALSRQDLTGAEIKNVVLNAARAALARGPRTRVKMADFQEAIAMEVDRRWTADGAKRMGFVRE